MQVDRKSTRLNSSHVETSYAVFCMKKKKNTPCGVEAKNAHKGLLQGGVHLEEDTTQYLDHRLRRLYYAYTLDCRSVAKELVGKGVAGPDGTGRELADRLAAQRDAQNQNRGCVAGIAKKLGTNGAQVFFFNDTATTEIYTLSLHDALPI